MSSEQLSLSQLALKHGSDKYGSHFYTPRYESHLAPFQHREIIFLEIGVGGYGDINAGGQSLRMWSEWFTHPNTRIIGIDIEEKVLDISDNRVFFRRGSQADAVFLEQLLEEFGKPDIVLDDGSHQPSHVIYTFEYLFSRLQEEALYIVEDTQTSYWNSAGGLNLEDPTHSYFKKFVEHINYAEIPGQGRPSYFDLHTTGIHFYHNLIILEKAENSEPSNVVPTRLGPHYSLKPIVCHSRQEQQTLLMPCALVAHLGGVGDVISDSFLSIRGSLEAGCFIQGFRLTHIGNNMKTEISYRVLYSDGHWSEFVAANEYAGTRGAGMSIAGYQFRCSSHISLISIGIFSNAPQYPIVAMDNQECVHGDISRSELIGMQLIIS